METKGKAIFILGCERSGSTWLSNILDSHPDVLLFMEPFADYAAIFPGFPHRNFYLSSIDQEYCNHVQDIINKLPDLKYSFTYQPGDPHWRAKLGQLYASGLSRLSRKLGIGSSMKLIQYDLLNLNGKEEPIFPKSEMPLEDYVKVTKELRLNFKVKLVKELYPNAKVLVSIRNPGAQLTSILKLIHRNGLPELRRSLLLFGNYVKSQARFKSYSGLIDGFEEKSIDEKLICWWLINYQVLIEDLRSIGLDYLIVHHEDLSENTPDEVERIFRFCRVKLDQKVLDYISLSSLSKVSDPSVVSTRRNSKSYYKMCLENVDNGLKNKIDKVITEHNTIKEIARYRQL